jgi:hypothetical protein
MPAIESPPSATILFTRQEKEKRSQQVYSLFHWIEIVRRFAYTAIQKARQKIELLVIAFFPPDMTRRASSARSTAPVLSASAGTTFR